METFVAMVEPKLNVSKVEKIMETVTDLFSLEPRSPQLIRPYTRQVETGKRWEREQTVSISPCVHRDYGVVSDSVGYKLCQ